MKVYVLSGQYEYEDYVVYGVFSSFEAAKACGDALVAESGGPREKWLSAPPAPEDWERSEYGDETWSIRPVDRGKDFTIAGYDLS